MSPASVPPQGRTRVVAGPSYWAARAEMKRAAWAAESDPALPEAAILEELWRRASVRGSRKRLAHELGFCPHWLSRVMSRNAAVSGSLAERLGYRVVKQGRATRIERRS